MAGARRDEGDDDDEPRARDALERIASRALLREVFGRVGEPPAPRPRTLDEQELEELRARRERALAAIDPRLVDDVTRHRAVADALAARLPPLPALVIERAPGHVDLRGFEVRGLGDEVAVERSPEIDEALDQAVPQAVLRDLHRPVRHFGAVELRPLALGYDRTGARARDAVRAAMATRHGGLAADQPTGSRVMYEELAGLAETLARPWEDSKPATPTAVSRVAPGPDDWQWFGLDGGYDPDQ